MHCFRLWLAEKLIPQGRWLLVNKSATRIILHTYPTIVRIDHETEESFHAAAVAPKAAS